jgi:hypothetical protein
MKQLIIWGHGSFVNRFEQVNLHKLSWKIILTKNFRRNVNWFYRFMTSQGNLLKFYLEIKWEALASSFFYFSETMFQAALDKQWENSLPPVPEFLFLSLFGVEGKGENNLHTLVQH